MALTRRDKILKLIVEDFIQTATPVGSEYLISKYNLDVSSATVRNEMKSLEDDGYIEKMHTSGGRVPSSLGYRYYIENLRTSVIQEEKRNELNAMFANSNSIDDILKESCEILSNMTNLASVVLGNGADEETLVNIQLVPINKNNATAIFVTDKGYVENKTFTISKDTEMNDVKKCMELLNDRLVGTKVSELVEKLENLKPVLSDYVSNYSFVYNTILKTFYDLAKERTNEFYGKENLIRQPEFNNDADELKRLFGLFEKPTILEQIVNKGGKEILIDAGEIDDTLKDVSVISKEIKINDEILGKIAVVGPSRMDYNMAIDSLNLIVQTIMSKLSVDTDEKGGTDEGKEC